MIYALIYKGIILGQKTTLATRVYQSYFKYNYFADELVFFFDCDCCTAEQISVFTEIDDLGLGNFNTPKPVQHQVAAEIRTTI